MGNERLCDEGFQGGARIMIQAVDGNPFAVLSADRFTTTCFGELLNIPMWGAIGVRLVKEAVVLSNYDAKAVAEVLGLVLLRASRPSSVSSVFIEKAVESGLPRNALRHVAELIAGGDKAKASALERGIVPKTTLERREKKLSPQESERTERIARLFVHARRALGTEAEAREFMTAPHPELDGRNPIEAARTDLGARRTEQILNALEYGLAL
jgi:putative toxin-antitoxin system antitoxin component (TIGR02293 family)